MLLCPHSYQASTYIKVWMLFLVLIWTHDICLDQASCMVLCSWSADQIVLCSCAAATHPKHHAHFLFWACSTERSVFSKDSGGNCLMLVQPSFTLPLISLVRALAYTGIQEGGDVWCLSGEAGCRAVLNGNHLALQGKMFFFSLSLTFCASFSCYCWGSISPAPIFQSFHPHCWPYCPHCFFLLCMRQVGLLNEIKWKF